MQSVDAQAQLNKALGRVQPAYNRRRLSKLNDSDSWRRPRGEKKPKFASRALEAPPRATPGDTRRYAAYHRAAAVRRRAFWRRGGEVRATAVAAEARRSSALVGGALRRERGRLRRVVNDGQIEAV